MIIIFFNTITIITNSTIIITTTIIISFMIILIVVVIVIVIVIISIISSSILTINIISIIMMFGQGCTGIRSARARCYYACMVWAWTRWYTKCSSADVIKVWSGCICIRSARERLLVWFGHGGTGIRSA